MSCMSAVGIQGAPRTLCQASTRENSALNWKAASMKKRQPTSLAGLSHGLRLIGFALSATLPFSVAAGVQVCNKSRTNDLFVASVLYAPLADLVGSQMLSWVGNGYELVPAGDCVTIRNTTKNTAIWLRVVSQGRFIPGDVRGSGNSDLSATNSSFCVNPVDNFKWARKNEQAASTDCAVGSGPAPFSFQITVRSDRSEFSIPVDPDPIIARYPPEVIAVRVPPPPTNYPRMGDEKRVGFPLGVRPNVVQKAVEAGLKTTGWQGDVTLQCTYGVSFDIRKEYVYWAKQIDRDILSRLHEIEGGGDFAKLGIRPVANCPAMESQAIELMNRNITDWRNFR